MKWRLDFALIFLQILVFVTANGFYSIVAPDTIQSNSDYTVSVTLHQNSEAATIEVCLEGPSYKDTKTVDVSPSQTDVVNFKVPQLKEGSYKLDIKGVTGLIFEESTQLNFKNKQPKVYIQTDKATYKPGDLVQFCFVALDENIRPAKLEQYLRLSFKDGAGNLVKQKNDIILYNGVYSGEFQLSEEPVLGNWMMEVSLGPNEDDIKTEKKFDVAKFSVEIETAKDISYDLPLKITVHSKYTYGKPVKGKATVQVVDQNGQALSEKIIDINGKGDVEFNLLTDLYLEAPTVNDRLVDNNFLPIHIVAIVTEQYMGNSQNRRATVNLHRSRYNIEVINEVYKRSRNYSFETEVYVKYLDGSPVQDGLARLKISKHMPISNEYYEEITIKSELNKNGMGIFKVRLPERVDYPFVRVEYADKIAYLPGFRRTDTSDVGPLKLLMSTEKLQLGKDVVVEVKSNEIIEYYVYAIVARGNIIRQGIERPPNQVKSHEIKFKPSFEMVPESRLYVYFVRDGNFVYQEMSLSFPREFQNKIEITAPERVKPGEEVTINIKTEPNSFVGVLGVDQSSLLLQSGNDLDLNQIFKDLSSFDTSTPSSDPGKSSGLVTITNAKYTEIPQNAMISYQRTGNNQRDLVGADNPSQIVRKYFEETWLFQTIKSTDANGLASLTKKIPDTINSWVVTGFSLNDKTGFGMVANPTNITVYKQFFISTNLPYAVKRGEIFSIPITLFNCMNTVLYANVSMDNTDFEYDFAEVFDKEQEMVFNDKEIVRKVSVPPNSGETVSFMIRTSKVGEITLKIEAITALGGDAILKKLKVEPEGITQYKNQAIFMESSKNPVNKTLNAIIPIEAVSDSEFLELSVAGDILGPAINNLESLLRLPYGCGEQNMMNFVHNILVLDYLNAIKREMPTLVQKAISHMEDGYQRELTFKHKNGAFSAFGEGSSEPNSWLTVYVTLYFIHAKPYITIDQNVIDQALAYLISTQSNSGQFSQSGKLFQPSHQNNVGFTAFALLALLEESDNEKYKSEIEKGIKYLVDNIDKENDTYALAIAAVVLKKTQHSGAAKLMEKLEKLAHEENGLKWWTKSSNDASNDIEITAYILQAYAYSEPTGQLLPIIKWLIRHRNSLGGFESTQDTVVGLQALIKIAEKYISAGDGEMTINFRAQDSEGKETTNGIFTVNKENSLILQTHVLPKSSREITLEAKGEGSSLIQLSYRYNLDTKDDKPSFTIKHTIHETPFPKILKMTVCAEFIPGANSDLKQSNMAIMEIYLPSGFTFDDMQLKPKGMQRVEIKYLNTAIIIYFDYLEVGKEVCFDVNAEKIHAVAKQKPSAIIIYDYYNPDQRATDYYIVKSSLCDICDVGYCGSCDA